MALFQITSSELTEKDLWIQSIQTELSTNLHIKSSAYDFDFIQGHPSCQYKNYEWVFTDTKLICEEHEESTRPSFNSHYEHFFSYFESQDTIPDIPNYLIDDIKL